jgi:hypothetical protein
VQGQPVQPRRVRQPGQESRHRTRRDERKPGHEEGCQYAAGPFGGWIEPATTPPKGGRSDRGPKRRHHFPVLHMRTGKRHRGTVPSAHRRCESFTSASVSAPGWDSRARSCRLRRFVPRRRRRSRGSAGHHLDHPRLVAGRVSHARWGCVSGSARRRTALACVPCRQWDARRSRYRDPGHPLECGGTIVAVADIAKSRFGILTGAAALVVALVLYGRDLVLVVRTTRIGLDRWTVAYALLLVFLGCSVVIGVLLAD